MAFHKRYDGAEPQRINKWLAQAGVCSRREAEHLIAEGLVSIDGAPVTDPGHKIAPGQTLALADRGGAALAAQITAVLNKPVGYVSAQPERGQIPAARLLTRAKLWPGPAANAPPLPTAQTKLAPLGRLDMDSRGLLLLSEDGVLAKAIIGPDSEIDKEYLVQVTGTVTARALEVLRHGLSLDGRRLRPAHVDPVAKDTLRFILREGRNRQIRRMCELVGLLVVDLQRIRIGPLQLGTLPEGRWRFLDADERTALISRRCPESEATHS